MDGQLQDALCRIPSEAFGGKLAWERMEARDFATQICARMRRQEHRTMLRLAEWRHSDALMRAVRKDQGDRARYLADRLHTVCTIRDVPESLMSGSIKEAVIKRSGLEYPPHFPG
jgi:hypothetical protein